MNFKTILLVIFLVAPAITHSADLDDPVAQRAKIDDLHAAAQNTPMSRPELLELCKGLDAVRWCEGYITAIITAYQIPHECLPRTDMAPFMNGAVWELTTNWIMAQPQDSRFSFFEALASALSEQDRCPMGNLLMFGDGPGQELVPYSDAEMREMLRLRQMLPSEVVEPIYPPLAKQEGIEGWCQVSYTVTETGAMSDIFIVDADPPNVFDYACIQAAEQFKYEPRLRNGVPIAIPNVQYVFRFNLDQQ